MRLLRTVLLLCSLGLAGLAAAANPVVEIRTSLGTIRAELFADKAPKTVENFLQYARDGFYEGTVFHRVIPGFMVQGGGFTPAMEQKKTRAPITNEAGNGLKNRTGTLAMARTPNPHSATAQFFINVADNAFLDFKAPNERGFGYAVFGRVVEGMDVVRRIESVRTAARPPHENVPLNPVVIERISVAGAQK